MIDEPDPLLMRLFAGQSRPEREPDFGARFTKLLERDWRKRRRYRTVTIFAGVTVAALLAPWVAQVAATAIGSAAAGIAMLCSRLNFPMAQLVICSIFASLLPTFYLGITRRW